MFEGFSTQQIDVGEAIINVTHGGGGLPVLLLHGYPQTHAMWHLVAPRLAEKFTVVAPDLRGYGDSSKPAGGTNSAGYSKRTMAADQVAVMQRLGFDRFAVVGHDRGARVAYRMALDQPQKVEKLALLDIVPTSTMFDAIGMIGVAAYHWLFLCQPFDLPERLIGSDPEFWLRWHLRSWSGGRDDFFAPEAVSEYIRCFSQPEAIHGACEDYRAGLRIDQKLDREDRDVGKKIACPLLALWSQPGGRQGVFDHLAVWKEWADDVRGHGIDAGHFLPEERPEDITSELLQFLE